MAKMPRLAAIGSSLGWGVSAVAFGLLPVWMSLLLPKISNAISFSEVDLLKSGSIIIFSITMTISVLVDYYLSRFRYSNKFIAILFNVFFPFAICLCGILIHIVTISTDGANLNVYFVLISNIGIAVFSILFCIFQKIILIYEEERGVSS